MLEDLGHRFYPMSARQLFIVADRMKVWQMMSCQELCSEVEFNNIGVSFDEVVDQLISMLPLMCVNAKPLVKSQRDKHLFLVGTTHHDSPDRPPTTNLTAQCHRRVQLRHQPTPPTHLHPKHQRPTTHTEYGHDDHEPAVS